MARREFSWDAEELIGEVKFSDKKKAELSFNTLYGEEGDDDREFISITTMQHFQNKRKGQEKAQWNITKNATFPLEVWQEIAEKVDNYIIEELMD